MSNRIVGVSLAALTVTLGLAAPRSASAQVFLTTEQANTFTPIGNLPGIGAITPIVFSSRDEGVETLTFPFAFNYLGQPMTTADLGVNGFLHFGTNAPSYTNYAINSASSENNTIYMWWDDMILPGTAGYADFGVIGAAPNRIFVIEVRDLEHYAYSTQPDIRLQVWLHEGPTGRFEIHYDGLATPLENYSATVGYEGPNNDGEPFGAFRPCSNASPYCNAAEYATLFGRRISVEQAVGPELVGSVGVFPRGALPTASVTGPVMVENVGTVDVTDVTCALYLSNDTERDAQDVNVGTFVVPSLVAAGGPTTIDVTVTVPGGTPPGNYYLLLAVDSNDAVAEAEENNNVAVAANRFATAYELRATSIVAQSGGNPGDSIDFNIDIANLGVPYTGPLELAIRASSNTTYEATDPLIDTFTVAANGGVAQAFQLTATVPALAPGDYYGVAIVDPLNALVEYDETNSAFVGALTFPSGPDFSASAVVVPPGATAGAPITFQLTVDNAGVAYSGPLAVRVQASLDPIFDVNDPQLGNTTVTLNGVVSDTVAVTVTMPVLAPGQWYPLFTLDPANVIPEIRDFDNRYVGATTFASGPNFSVLDITADAEAIVGQPLSVTTRIGSVGAPYTGAVSYRLLLSEDRMLSAQDVLLGTYTVNLTGQAMLDDTRTPGFPTVPPVDHYVIAQVDPGAVIVESNELDNVLADDDEVLSGPDLFVTTPSPDFDPATISPGETITVDATLSIDGAPYTGALTYRVVASEDSTIEPTDPELARATVMANGIGDIPITLTTPPITAPPGRYYVYVEVDPDNLIVERNETNNERSNFARLEILGPNLTPAIQQAGPVAFVGRPYAVELDISNTDDADSGTFRYAYYITRNGILANGTQVFVSAPVTVAAQATATFNDNIVLPVGTATGAVQLGVIVDFDDVVPETEEDDNSILVPGTVLVSNLVPDLISRLVTTATAAAAGESFAVTRVIENIGVADATAFEYAYYASTDAAITSTDILLATRTSSLAEGTSDYGIDVIDIPATVPPGTYWIGVLPNPTRALQEIDYANNASVPVQIPIYPAALTIFTTTLPDPRLGVPYEAGLFAVGGTVGHNWTIAGGMLPPGLMLDAASGLVSGTPSAEGTFTFTVRVTSGVAIADRPFTVRVRSATVDLMVASRSLPPAAVGAPYVGQLLAVGGADPYTWASAGTVPGGLTVQSDGRVTGTPELAGDETLTVRVTDAAGASVTADVVLRVVDPSRRVLITQSPLPVASVGLDLCDDAPVRLFASGGVMPYTWTVVDGDPGGLALSERGDLCGVPTTAGRFPFVVRVVDAEGTLDTSGFTLEVSSEGAIAVATLTLADGTVGVPYEATLRAARGTAPFTWAILAGTLPEGLEMSGDGLLSGTPAAVGSAAFIVEVTDANGASARAPLSIHVDAVATEDTGCSCQAARSERSGVWGLGLLLGAIAFRRRRRAAS